MTKQSVFRVKSSLLVNTELVRQPIVPTPCIHTALICGFLVYLVTTNNLDRFDDELEYVQNIVRSPTKFSLLLGQFSLCYFTLNAKAGKI